MSMTMNQAFDLVATYAKNGLTEAAREEFRRYVEQVMIETQADAAERVRRFDFGNAALLGLIADNLYPQE